MLNKKQIRNINNSFSYTLVLALVALVFGIGGYYLGSKKDNRYVAPNGNRWGYVTAQSAKEQVGNFYNQYIDHYNNQKTLALFIQGYGSNNLAFYNSYYRHGFNPITCSSSAPTAVSVTQATSGTTSTVYANLEYADHSKTTVKAIVIMNSDGLKIDSITCPGNKGNLLPQV